ncbi:hypothetical protein [Desulforamulus aquiferis]|uniref:Uncharacterized protein n=1 Tax=Desulforamulus aquiferis TaxID=1397668 RepID=A0AAW7ZEI9_9FIRM|nr:hypothetical protein [Desulforamulus aquiferis]MDO7787752.1 hypothetical protein [Desulforamulus aquiferis]RYD03130.1 hypothetical protein N752_21275 [Desulforamulus aquiferis]
MNKIVEYFERPEVGKAVRYIFYASLVLLLIAELFIEKHPYFHWAAFPTFFAVYGFFACAVIIAVSKLLGKFWLQKGEDYYD